MTEIGRLRLRACGVVQVGYETRYPKESGTGRWLRIAAARSNRCMRTRASQETGLRRRLDGGSAKERGSAAATTERVAATVRASEEQSREAVEDGQA